MYIFQYIVEKNIYIFRYKTFTMSMISGERLADVLLIAIP